MTFCPARLKWICSPRRLKRKSNEQRSRQKDRAMTKSSVLDGFAKTMPGVGWPTVESVAAQEPPKRMKPNDRHKWLRTYMSDHSPGCTEWYNILNSDFVNEYSSATGAPVQHTTYGADKCLQLAADLKAMYDRGWLKRRRTGIKGMAGMGIPKWIWNYYV
jgi:hypothetical protein